MSDKGELPNLSEYRKTYTNDGLIAEYACEYLTSPEVAKFNRFENVIVPAYYDMVYDCYDDPSKLADLIASRLVESAASHWRITPTGDVCDGTGQPVDHNMIIAVSSQPGPEQIDEFSCQALTPGDGECCTVVYNQMTFTPYPGYSEMDLWAYVADQLNSGDLALEEQEFTTKFIGSLIDEPPQDGTTVKGPPNTNGVGTVSAVQGGPQAGAGGNKNSFTAVGGVILGGLLAVLVGLGVLLVRRRQKDRSNRRRNNMTMSGMESDDEYLGGVQVLSDRRNLNGMPDGLPVGATGHEVLSPKFEADRDNFRVNVTYHTSSSVGDENNVSTPSTPNRFNVHSLANSLSEDDEQEFDSRESSYAWDLSNSFQREVMGMHTGASPREQQQPSSYYSSQQELPANLAGPTTIEVVPPYPMMDETSESEADSWAQTDASVGSLDVKLEQITAEI